jgi:hypothetical protein
MFVDDFFAARHHRCMERQITHSCGHTAMHSIYAQCAADYDRQDIRLARQKCAGCREATKQARGDADAVLIAAIPVAELAGSPKQVAWAATIRAARLARLQRAGSRAVGHLACVSDAKWWIDNRSADDAALLACQPGVQAQPEFEITLQPRSL